MKGRLLVGFCLSLSFLGSLAAQAPPPTQGQVKDPPLVQGATQGSSGLWEAKVKIGPCTFEMVQIPPGTFQMGTDATGIGWIEQNGLRPVHSVAITRPFLMQKYSVTVAQFKAFVEATGYRTQAEVEGGAKVHIGSNWVSKPDVNWRNPAFAQEDSCPVVCVSWNDAQAFVGWLNGKGGDVAFRLPTEAEWEYACRAGTTSERYGSLDAIAWFGVNSDNRTHPVGQKQPNAFGLFDMLGNAWQWCQDVFEAGYYTSSPSQDPQGPSDGVDRAERGCSWRNWDVLVRAAARDHDEKEHRRNDLGFRVVAVARTQ